MTDKKKNGWVKFIPSLDLPKERVSIAYDTHDKRGVKYAYGYFQFYNGTCGCFWKDGNEQPKVVKAEDIKYWMPIPSLDIQEEPVSEDLGDYVNELSKQFPDVSFAKLSRIAVRVAKWQKEQFEKNRLKHCNSITNEQAELEQKFLDEHLDKYNRMPTFLDAIEYGMRLQKEQMMKGAFEFTQKHNDACVLASECLRNNGWFNREHDFNDLFLYLSCVDELFAGKFSGKTKVIVIKED